MKDVTSNAVLEKVNVRAPDRCEWIHSIFLHITTTLAYIIAMALLWLQASVLTRG